jgi:hypothetical protein
MPNRKVWQKTSSFRRAPGSEPSFVNLFRCRYNERAIYQGNLMPKTDISVRELVDKIQRGEL